MKLAKRIVAGVAVVMAAVIFLVVRPAAADDNEIFGVVQQEVEPNILIIFDNSRSMTDNFLELDKDEQECDDCEYADWQEVCTGRGPNRQCESKCRATRMDVAKNTVKNLIDACAADNRLGVMIFHENGRGSDGGYIPEYQNRYGTCSVKDTFVLDDTGQEKTGQAYDEAITAYKTYLRNLVDDIAPATYTPLAETLAEAGRYFAGEASLFNADNEAYPDSGTYPGKTVKAWNPNVSHPPIGYWCRKNYIILMTDGEPTNDSAGVLRDQPYLSQQYLPASGRYPEEDADFYSVFYKDNHPELQDIAGFLYETDINRHLDGKQNICTYTVGFSEGVGIKAQNLLQDTADRGMGENDTPYADDGGLFFYATGEQALADAFETIMANIEEKDSVFAPVSVPVSDKNMAYAGDYGYVSMFRPVSGQSRWVGNLKKYRLNEDNDFASCNAGQDPILDDQGRIRENAVSCWSPEPDGGNVKKGGAGQKLSQMTDSERNIYTNLCAQSNILSAPDNWFCTQNSSLSADDFGVADKNRLIDNIRMVDQGWKLGDFNHSRPAVASYGTGVKYIFAGANDGMLHCFDDSDGSEAWAFVPAEQFWRLEEVYTGDHSYFMDGSPVVADTKNRKILICGERRGGNRYYAIDITDIDNPAYLYTHDAGGQSWKTPQFVKAARSSSTAADAFLLTGGYDPAYDSRDDPDAPAGNSVVAVEASSGAEILRFDHTHPDLAAMTHSIVSAFGADTVDDGKSVISRIYAGDLGGGLFAFRDDNDPDSPKALDGDWQALHLFSATGSGRKIFEQADFVREFMKYYDPDQGVWQTVAGDWLYFGTGDRADPMGTDAVNYFYCIKNDWHTGPLTTGAAVADYATVNDPGFPEAVRNEPVIIDVSDNLIQDGTLSEKEANQRALNRKYNRGWYIQLEHKGEKCLSAPVVYAGVVYFTTFTPESGTGGSSYDPCTATGSGTARLYALDYKTGGAVYDHFDGDKEDDLGKDDRCTEIDNPLGSIPASPELVITQEGTSVLNFPDSHPVRDQAGVRQFYWKQRQ